jgi:hypothetical protein
MQGCAVLDFVYRIFGRDLFVAVIRVAEAVDLNKRPFLESQPKIQIGGINPNVYTGLIDVYGQSSIGTWPEKIAGDADLINRDNAELTQLQQWVGQVTGLDTFQGVTSIPLTSGSEYFTTAKSGGTWWIVTPNGNAFFQLGLENVEPDEGRTFTTGRESIFQNLDSLKTSFQNQYQPYGSSRTFNFYSANLVRKYGAGSDPSTGIYNWFEKWVTRTNLRIKGWGFNTIGAQSDDQFSSNSTLPFAVRYKIDSTNVLKVSSNRYGSMPDVFDPNFQTAADSMASAIPGYIVTNRYLIGYFVDNELPWGDNASSDYKALYSIPVGTLALDYNSSPSKQQFIAQLQQKYQNITSLATAWGLNITSWDTLKGAYNGLPTAANAAIIADLEVFLRKFADQYFRIIKTALSNRDGKHLYIGCRFAQRPRAVIEECAQYCDVVSFNFYSLALYPYQKSDFTWIQKPILVSEFHFGSTDRGLFSPGVIDAGSEANRGLRYAQFAKAWAALPNCVGLDWFQYVDEPTAGRPADGSHAHIGMVSVGDVPFQDFVSGVRQTNLILVKNHSAATSQ